ncbi:anaerobic glycerol-3-phosphate dehydrogenase subunit C [bacterium BMS3Bbin10]|nr:anaerobic glycerol-3-phosphate dehydrogenase subunit C [bacterium BMS3Bbin10]
MSSPDEALESRLRKNIEGDVLFDAFSRGRYATDASIYQIMPQGVAVPKTEADLAAIIEIAHEEGLTLLPRGGGTSQSGQSVGDSLVVDFSKYLHKITSLDPELRTCTVQPGIVLDRLNAQLKRHRLWFPVDVSTASRATIGGMAGNNSCGTRSIRYGIMRDNVTAIDAILADGTQARFAEVPKNLNRLNAPSPALELMRDLIEIGRRRKKHIGKAFPKVSRRVGGYLLDALVPGETPVNLAQILIGSEGTLAFSRAIELKLSPLPGNKALGVCHFPTFRKAMEAAQHIVKLGPSAVELIDKNLIELARDIPMFRATVNRFVKGEPEALLITEFSQDNQVENLRRLNELDDLMRELGHKHAVVEAVGARFQKAIWEVRKSGLNIMMSMKSDGKPVSFIEDCAVPLEHLADYTERLSEVFEKHGTRGTWYAHASVGCLHVRPILNLKLEKDAVTMRAIAEEAFEMVREYKGAHSGEHGDGLVRSEFHETMYGCKTVEIFEQVKDRFDPGARLNPGKITRAPKMNDRTLFRYKPDYAVAEMDTGFDWSGWTGAGGGFQGAVEMCNNNGACRKFDAGVMCPSYRVTRNESDVTRGRANTLRLAISGQLGEGALTSPEMLETMKHCVSCKACRRECPTGVDMAKMKIEVLRAHAARHGLALHDRLVATLPRYAPFASRLPGLFNLRNTLPGMPALAERLTGFSRHRPLPRWRSGAFREKGPFGPQDGRDAVLFVDTFNRYFEPETIHAALRVLGAAGTRIHIAHGRGRPLCCGRTYLSAGLVEKARAEAGRFLDAITPHLDAGRAIIGLEPSCLFTLRDEFPSLLPGKAAEKLAQSAVLLSQYLINEKKARRLVLKLKAQKHPILLHGHCHQKSFAAMDDAIGALQLIPGAKIETIQSGCCGMAGAYGYGKDTFEMSMAMGELSLLPAVRDAGEATLLVADGFSCRHQIHDGTGRRARHGVHLLDDALPHSSGKKG